MKNCSKCGIDKSFGDFNKKSSSKDGYRSQCCDCQKIEGSTYYINNKSVLKTKHKKYYENNRDKVIKQTKIWNDKNPEKRKAKYLRYRHANLEKCRARDENYRLRNMDKDAAKTAKRRALKFERTPKWLDIEHYERIQSFYTLAKLRESVTDIKYHVDHIVPLNGENVCGLHVPWNLQVIPAIDNLIKSNHLGELSSVG